MTAVVFLHGFAQTPASWREVLAALGPALPAVALSTCPAPGHAVGWPVATDWDATLAALAGRLPAGAIVVGYSLGARLALGLLARDAIAAAVLISVHPGLADAGDRADRRQADAAWSARLRAGGTAAFLDAWEAQPVLATAARGSPAIRAERRAARQQLEPQGLAAAMDVLGLGAMPDLTAALRARADRVHLIAGADDAKFRLIAERLAPALPATIVAGSGHDPTLDAPEVLAATLAATLARWT